MGVRYAEYGVFMLNSLTLDQDDCKQPHIDSIKGIFLNENSVLMDFLFNNILRVVVMISQHWFR